MEALGVRNQLQLTRAKQGHHTPGNSVTFLIILLVCGAGNGHYSVFSLGFALSFSRWLALANYY